MATGLRATIRQRPGKSLSEGCRVVACLARPAEVSLMSVIVRVTGDTRSWKGNLLDVLLSMARRASQPGMRAGQRKMRLLVVVEPPDGPAVWRVAGAASGAKTAFVMCVAVAAGTGSRRVLVGSRLVTLLAWNDGVLAEKWKA